MWTMVFERTRDMFETSTLSSGGITEFFPKFEIVDMENTDARKIIFPIFFFFNRPISNNYLQLDWITNDDISR